MAESRKAKFTPGPWGIDSSRYVVGSSFTDADGDTCVPIIAVLTGAVGPNASPEANGKLIISAPDMAEALQMIYDRARGELEEEALTPKQMREAIMAIRETAAKALKAGL